MTTHELLVQTAVFGSLDEKDLAALAAACRLRRFARGVALFQAGDPGDTLFVLCSGQVKIVLETDGTDFILCLAGPGECLGELSLIDGQPRSATAIAVEPVEALALSQTELLALIRHHPTIGLALMRRLAAMVRCADGHVHDILSLDATARIAKLLLEIAASHGEATEDGICIALPLTQRELGEMAGVTRWETSRALDRLEQRGILTTCRRGITIRRPDLLRQPID
jgi:CRP/FNR family transcriptional regulator/CRP/FNR family cyclic AMP-dependent transcriptional regulator